MNRRDSLIALSALGLASAAPRGFAQAKAPGPIRRIGVIQLAPEADPKLPGPQRRGSQALRKLGWIEGENVIWERAFADNQVERLDGLANALIRKGVEVLITIGPEATLAAARDENGADRVLGRCLACRAGADRFLRAAGAKCDRQRVLHRRGGL